MNRPNDRTVPRGPGRTAAGGFFRVRFALVAGGSVLVALALAEVALRAAGVKFDASLYASDPVTGWRLRPNAQGWWVSEGRAFVRLNTDGMNDREYPLTKPPATVRIAVLGDSMTAAAQVPVEANFCRVMERELAACGPLWGKRIEVMNFGVPGFGTAQQLLQFRRQVARYGPDAVVLAFFPYNDVQNNHRRLNPVDADNCPYFLLQNGELVLDDSFRQNRSRWYAAARDAFGDLANRSRVLQLLAEVGLRRSLFRRLEETRFQQLGQRFGGDPGFAVLQPPADPLMQEAWRVTEALIMQLRNEAEQRGMRFWLVTLPQRPQTMAREARTKYVEEYGIQDLFYAHRRLEELARRSGMRAIILGPPVSEWADRNPQESLVLTVHFSETGHRVVGTLIARGLCESW